MRTLNTSLPSPRPAPPEQLLQAFRTAALSVTNLYKSAVTDQNNARQAGYQEALEDLLTFLDRENLGLQDGEGWRVRQWATERYDGSGHYQQSEGEDDRDDQPTDHHSRRQSTSPVREQMPPPAPTPAEERPSDQATPNDDVRSPASEPVEPAPMFHFTGGRSDHPSDDMQTDDNPTLAAVSPEGAPGSSSTASPAPPIRVELLNSRGNRTSHRHSGQRHGGRPSTRDFTFTAGTKRKIHFPDFFDISNIGPRDGPGGSKRGRWV